MAGEGVGANPHATYTRGFFFREGDERRTGKGEGARETSDSSDVIHPSGYDEIFTLYIYMNGGIKLILQGKEVVTRKGGMRGWRGHIEK